MSDECEYHHGANPECPMCWAHQPAKAASELSVPAITPEIGEACARLLLSDSRLIAIVDSYSNGRLILSALHNRYGCRYQDNRKAQHDLIVALGHESWAGNTSEPFSHIDGLRAAAEARVKPPDQRTGL